VENKTKIMQHVIKFQESSLLPKYIKLISWGSIFMCLHVCEHRSFKR